MRRIVLVTAAFAITSVLATHAFGQSMTQTLPQQGSPPPQQYSPPPQPQSSSPDNAGNTLQIAPQDQPTPSPYYNAAGALAGALATYLNQNANRPAPPPQAPIPPAVAPPPATNEASSGLAMQGQPVLPAEFRGCWQGTVVGLDSNDRLPGAHKVGYWTPKTYRLCYRRRGDGPFQLTFSRMGVEANDSISNAHGTVVALSTDGHDYAKMRSRLAFDEYSRDEGAAVPVDETTMLDCRISGDQMRVSANVYGTRDGEPWFRARWHAEFAQVPE